MEKKEDSVMIFTGIIYSANSRVGLSWGRLKFMQSSYFYYKQKQLAW